MFWRFDELFGKSCKKCLISWKSTKTIDLAKLCNFFEQTTMFWCFDELLRKRLQKVAQFVKKHEKSSIWPNFATFRTNYHVFAFRWTFPEKVAKSASYRVKARKTIDLAKTFNFFSKLPYLGIFMNFSARSCKKCLISWKSTRNHWFGQNYATFSNKLPCFAFRWTFQEKVAKSASFREKHEKSSIWPKLCNFSNKLPCFFLLTNFSRKKLQKVVISWKSTKNHRFCQLATFRKTTMFSRFDEHCSKKLQKAARAVKKREKSQFGQIFATFWTNFDVFAFRWIFKEKVAKSASFRETTMFLKSASFRQKARKTINLAKTCNFSTKLPCFFWHFHELFSKKLQKVPHLVKKHEKSSIWQKLSNFLNKLPCFCILMNF